MKFDIALPNCMEGFLVPANFAGPAELVRFAQEAEQLGYYALWGFDFTAPVSDLRGRPSDGAEPNWYELMITLASLSGVTKTIKLGAGVVIIPLRDPVILAKQSATLDQFSNGRFLLGLGLGGSREEFVTVRPRSRGAHRGNMLDEKLDALELLLNGDGPGLLFRQIRGVREHGAQPQTRAAAPAHVPGSPRRSLSQENRQVWSRAHGP